MFIYFEKYLDLCYSEDRVILMAEKVFDKIPKTNHGHPKTNCVGGVFKEALKIEFPSDEYIKIVISPGRKSTTWDDEWRRMLTSNKFGSV